MGEAGTGVAFVPPGMIFDLPPWQSAWWRTTICLVQLTVQDPRTGEFFAESLHRADRDVLHGPSDVESAKRILIVWAEEKARLMGLGEGGGDGSV